MFFCDPPPPQISICNMARPIQSVFIIMLLLSVINMQVHGEPLLLAANSMQHCCQLGAHHDGVLRAGVAAGRMLLDDDDKKPAKVSMCCDMLCCKDHLSDMPHPMLSLSLRGAACGTKHQQDDRSEPVQSHAGRQAGSSTQQAICQGPRSQQG